MTVISRPSNSAGSPNAVAREACEADLAERLLHRLAAGPLPGREAQRTLEPELAFGRHAGPAPHDARRAAVMILLYPHEGRWHVPLTVRPSHLAAHGGQVSFPGGVIEPGESPREAAIRELHEELNVPTDAVRPLGPLSPLYIFGTGFDVEPWSATAERRPALVANAGEVAAVLEAPLDQLLDPRHRGEHRRQVRGVTQTVPHVEFDGHLIWGATAMILAEFLTLVREALGAQPGDPS